MPAFQSDAFQNDAFQVTSTGDLTIALPLISSTATVYTPAVQLPARVSSLVVEAVVLPTSQEARVSSLVIEVVLLPPQTVTLSLTTSTATIYAPVVERITPRNDQVIWIV